MATYDRRSFLRTTVSTIALANLPFPICGEENVEQPTIIRRVLGRTNLRLPVVSFGVMRADSAALVRAAYDAGVIHFDTAHSYQQGRNEMMLGEVFENVPRDSYILATKIQPRDREKGKIGKDMFLERLDISLQRLKTSYVDILYAHALGSRDDVFDTDILSALEEAKKKKKARFIGVSTHRNVEEVIEAMIECGAYDVVLAAMNFQHQNPKRLREVTAAAAKAGIGIVAMKTMAGAYYDKERTKPINCKAALKWVLEDPNVATTIPGVTTFEQLRENLSVNYDCTLTDEERASLIVDPQSKGMSCDGCEQCVQTCKHHIPALPDTMRAYMYAYGYSAPRQAREILDEVSRFFELCYTCGECTANCVKAFPIAERIRDIQRLTSVPQEFLA
ncbi:MAG: aldo/keto reductase [Bacteroidetes bacterium]|nr:aldo/keto reductase [Bacteroidota bacterium]